MVHRTHIELLSPQLFQLGGFCLIVRGRCLVGFPTKKALRCKPPSSCAQIWGLTGFPTLISISLCLRFPRLLGRGPSLFRKLTSQTVWLFLLILFYLIVVSDL